MASWGTTRHNLPGRATVASCLVFVFVIVSLCPMLRAVTTDPGDASSVVVKAAGWSGARLRAAESPVSGEDTADDDDDDPVVMPAEVADVADVRPPNAETIFAAERSERARGINIACRDFERGPPRI